MKKAIATLITIGSVLVTPLSALAAPEKMPDGEIFDAEYYAQNNPDVVAVFGTDKNALYQHYLVAGQLEGRLPYAGYVSPDAFLSTLAQKKIAAFRGVYTKNGITEAYPDWIVYSVEDNPVPKVMTDPNIGLKTDESYYFDYVKYATDYPAVCAAVGNSKEALWNHFKTQGVHQGLRAYATSEFVNAELVGLYTIPQIVAGVSTQRDQIKAVHDWMIKNISYDWRYYRNGPEPSSSHRIEGGLLYHTAVCEGYADTFDYFMSLIGVNADLAVGQADGYGGVGGHAWSRVVVDGQVLFVDVTFDDDDSKSGRPRYNYFLKTEQQLSRDHLLEKFQNIF